MTGWHPQLLIGRRPSWPAVRFVRSFAVVNMAFATGWLNVIRGREIDVWHRAEWRAETEGGRVPTDDPTEHR